jgi:hypothetical protein
MVDSVASGTGIPEIVAAVIVAVPDEPSVLVAMRLIV